MSLFPGVQGNFPIFHDEIWRKFLGGNGRISSEIFGIVREKRNFKQYCLNNVVHLMYETILFQDIEIVDDVF